MKLDYSHFFDLISADAQVVIDCEVWWEKGTPSLVVNDVLEREGKVSLLHSTEDKFSIDCALRILDAAEDDERLLARAVEQWDDEREAA